MPAVLNVLEYARPKYACRQCEKTQDNIILGKYQYAMPLYLRESFFTQSGIELFCTTMERWVIQVSEKFAPLYAALKEHLQFKQMKRRLMCLKKRNSVACCSTDREPTRQRPHYRM
jgi:transposase